MTTFELFPDSLLSPLADLDGPLLSPPTLDDIDFDERVAHRHIDPIIGFDDSTQVSQDLTISEMMDGVLTDIEVVMGLLPRDVLDEFDEDDLRGRLDFDEFGEFQQRTT